MKDNNIITVDATALVMNDLFSTRSTEHILNAKDAAAAKLTRESLAAELVSRLLLPCLKPSFPLTA